MLMLLAPNPKRPKPAAAPGPKKEKVAEAQPDSPVEAEATTE
jgi:hypothetical protein